MNRTPNSRYRELGCRRRESLRFLSRPSVASRACWLIKCAQPLDAIDFTDNDIQILGNFPLSPRVTTLLLARNRVANIQPALSTALPNLQNLVLASNNLAQLADLDTLGQFSRLTHLVLADNPVTKKEVSHTDHGKDRH